MAGSLSADQWRQFESLLDALLDTPPDRRAALFAKVSGGDDQRRVELEQMVAACERSYPLLDLPAAERFSALIDPGPLRADDVIAGRYRIVREIGRGGMATVYLAHDAKHAREVALKVVRAELVASVGSKRFLREIEIAAQLRHPNIVPLFDSGEWRTEVARPDGECVPVDVLYYTMPYEPGQSLRERLRREHRLSVPDTIVILRDVCEALAHAHSRGVVHRDIKPDNILMSGRHALVSDFGIARAPSEVAGAGPSGSVGILVGTPAYMAPELAIADPSADDRTDIYAVGVLGYELLTGKPPFAGRPHHDTLAAQVSENPKPLTHWRPEVPTAVAHLIMRCLEKEPADRLPSAEAVLHELDAFMSPITVESPRAAHRSLALRSIWPLLAALAVIAIVVAYRARAPRASSLPDTHLNVAILPVQAAGARGELDWVATGLQSRLAVELAPVPALAVLPTPTIHALVRSNWPLDRVALEHDVDYFVEASVSKGMSDSLLLSLVLIERGLRTVRVADLRMPGPPATTIEALGHELSRRLRPLLGSRARERELERGVSNPEALRTRRLAEHQRVVARELIRKGDLDQADHALDSAAALLIATERLDPTWNAPRVARASLHATRAFVSLQRTNTPDRRAVNRLFDESIALLDSILRRTPNDAAALALRGRVRWQRLSAGFPSAPDRLSHADLARLDLGAALAIDSTLVWAAADLSHILFEAFGRYDEAAAYAERAYRIDSFLEGASQVIGRLARSHFEMGRDSAAAYWCAEGIRRFHGNPAHTACMLDVMAWGLGPAVPESAWAHYRALERQTAPSNRTARFVYGADVAAVLARASPALGDSARAVLARVKRDVERHGGNAAIDGNLLPFEAAVLFRLGDRERALELLSRLSQRDSSRASLVSRQRMLRDYTGIAPSDRR